MNQQRNQFLHIFPNCTGSSLYVVPQLLQGYADNTSIHSAIWKFFMVIKPNCKKNFATADDWVSILNEKRKNYFDLKAKHFVKPSEEDDSVDPLLSSQNSEWNQFFSDQDLRKQICRDTTRTFQEIDFFQDPTVLKNLEDILFLFCRTHPKYEYAQGLHEIAAVIYYVFSQEMKSEDNDAISFVFNINSIIPDAFFTFSALAEALEPLYRPSSSPSEPSYCAILAERIQGELLAKESVELSEHLSQNNIAPQTYLVQWLRLLFIRVFDLESAYSMWDLIISQLPDISVITYTAVTILLNAKNTLLASGPIELLKFLFHFPKLPNPARFVVQAIEKYTRPKKRMESEDVKFAVAERLNDLSRGLSELCSKHNLDEALPYIMDLRRTRDCLLGILPLDDMLPLEQAVALFRPTPVELNVVVEKEEEKVHVQSDTLVLPKAGTSQTTKVSSHSMDLLFEEDSSPKKKKKGIMRLQTGGKIFE